MVSVLIGRSATDALSSPSATDGMEQGPNGMLTSTHVPVAGAPSEQDVCNTIPLLPWASDVAATGASTEALSSGRCHTSKPVWSVQVAAMARMARNGP